MTEDNNPELFCQTVELSPEQIENLSGFGPNAEHVFARCAQLGFTSRDGEADWPQMAPGFMRTVNRHRDNIQPVMRQYIRAGAMLRELYEANKE